MMENKLGSINVKIIHMQIGPTITPITKPISPKSPASKVQVKKKFVFE